MGKQQFIEINNDFDYNNDFELGKGRQLIKCNTICDVYVVLPDRVALSISFRNKNNKSSC